MQHIAILGISKTSLHLAALFANTGRKVFLFGKTRKEAKAAKEDIFFMNPMPLISYERGSFINCYGLDNDLDEFHNLDLIIEGWDKSIEERKLILSSVMQHFKKSAVILSLYQGNSVSDLANSLNSWLRPHFLGIHFFFNPKFNRLVELIPSLKTEKKTLLEVEEFLKNKLGRFPVVVADKPNLIADRIVIFLTCAAIYRAKQLKISIEDLEALTKLVFSHLGGILFLNQYIGNQRVIDIFKNIDPKEKNIYKDIFNSFEDDYLIGKVFYEYYQGRFKFKLNKQVILEPELIKNFNKREWSFFAKKLNPHSSFIYFYLIDLWQYLAYICKEENILAQDLDDILLNAFGLNTRFFHLLQEFSPKEVFSSTIEENKEGNVSYPILDDWKRKKTEKINADKISEDIFLKEAILKLEKNNFNLYVYKKKLLVFYIKDDYIDITYNLLEELLEAVNYAKNNELAFMLYLKSKVFGGLRTYKDLKKEDISKTLEKLSELVVALRMLERPFIFAATGMVADSGLAIMMQADQIICEFSFSWKITTISENLPPFGAVWFEWLRRIPRFTKEVSLHYIHAIVNYLLSNNAEGRAYTAKEMGMFRANDYLLMTPDALPTISKEFADITVSGFFNRYVRYPVAKLSELDLEFFKERAKRTSFPDIYLDTIKMLAEEEQTKFISLRKLLKSEIKLLSIYCNEYCK